MFSDENLTFKEFEEHVERVLKRKYPKKDWEIEPQSPIKNIGKVDFRVKHRRSGKQVLVDAKSGKVTDDDVRQVKDYKASAKASEAIIYTATPRRDISPRIADRAKTLGIKIEHTKPKDLW